MTQEGTAPAPPQPTTEHEALRRNAGQWKVECEFIMEPGQPPMKVQATDTVEAFGPFWVQGTFRADMFGAPYQGRATLGYEPSTGEYHSTWIDSMSPSLFHFTGRMDESGKVLEMRGRGLDCSSKRMTDYRTREERISDDERVFEMFMVAPDGSEVKMFTHHYRRA